MRRLLAILMVLGLVALGGPAAGQDAAAPTEAPAEAPAPAADPPPAPDPPPEQVIVSAKVIEFQATKGVETGLSAYFQRRDRTDWFGVVKPAFQGLMTADVTFPASSARGITVFLDRIRLTEGDIEMVLQALVDENRASILSQPKVVVMTGGEPTTITTSQEIPYENTVVVGATTVQSTAFRPTGVTMAIGVPQIMDMDGDWTTTDDTFVELDVDARVSEEGQRIVVGLDDQLAAGGSFAAGQNAITAPEFVSRSITTKAWVRHGQVLVLGGLYNNRKTRSLSTAPWLTQAEDIAVGLAERAVPGDYLVSPMSATFGNRATNEARRELVFLIKAEAWRPVMIVPEERGFLELEEEEDKRSGPADVITDVIGGITELPQGIGEGIRKQTEGGIESELGGAE